MSSFSPPVLLHFFFGKRENVHGCFSHVAKHPVGQGKVWLIYRHSIQRSLLTPHLCFWSVWLIFMLQRQPPCPHDLQSYQMDLCCCPIPWLLRLKSLPEPPQQQLCDFTRFSSTYLFSPECISACPSRRLSFSRGYQCRSTIAYRLKSCTKPVLQI